MAEYERKVRQILKENGCYFVRHGKGDHEIFHVRFYCAAKLHDVRVIMIFGTVQ